VVRQSAAGIGLACGAIGLGLVAALDYRFGPLRPHCALATAALVWLFEMALGFAGKLFRGGPVRQVASLAAGAGAAAAGAAVLCPPLSALATYWLGFMLSLAYDCTIAARVRQPEVRAVSAESDR